MYSSDGTRALISVYSSRRLRRTTNADHKPMVLSLFIFQDSGPSCTIVLFVRSRFCLGDTFITC